MPGPRPGWARAQLRHCTTRTQLGLGLHTCQLSRIAREFHAFASCFRDGTKPGLWTGLDCGLDRGLDCGLDCGLSSDRQLCLYTILLACIHAK